MRDAKSYNLREISEHFDIRGNLICAYPHDEGHINDTFLGEYQTAQGLARYVHQRINHEVFKEPVKVMDNIDRVTRYARQQVLAAGGDPARETLTLVPARDGLSYYHSPDGSYWRTYLHIEGARTYNTAVNLGQVYHAARAFGRFMHLLDALPGPRLHETIPNFHHTRLRFEAFQAALQADAAGRASNVKAEIDFILRREKDASVVVDLLARGELPERVTHNDTKLNNVLIDDVTGEGICVIDLDTVMPGSALYDFGDLIRMGTTTAAEDERDLSKVGVDLSLFTELARGFLDATRNLLTPTETSLLVFGGRLITYEQAIRFLTDYLNGDVYYKTHYAEQNLDRARTQIRMVEDMEGKQAKMEAILHRLRR